MSDWKTFFRKHRGILLTLPGAALWSLPIGLFGWEWLKDFVPSLPGIRVPYRPAILGALILTPMAMVCSMIAMLNFIDRPNQVSPFVGFLLIIFNFITTFATGCVIAILVLGAPWWQQIFD